MSLDGNGRTTWRNVWTFGAGAAVACLLTLALEAAVTLMWRWDWGISVLAWEPLVEGRTLEDLVDPYLLLMIGVLAGAWVRPGAIAAVAYLGAASCGRWAGCGIAERAWPLDITGPTPTAEPFGLCVDVPAIRWGAMIVCSALMGVLLFRLRQSAKGAAKVAPTEMRGGEGRC